MMSTLYQEFEVQVKFFRKFFVSFVAAKDLIRLAANRKFVPTVQGNVADAKEQPASKSFRNIPQVVDDEIERMKKSLSPEQRKRIMNNGFKQEQLRRQVEKIFAQNLEKRGILKGRGFEHETDPGQVRNVIQHYFHQFL